MFKPFQYRYDVTIYEAREKLGGNAQCATFDVGGGQTVRQDLSVLFWAPEYVVYRLPCWYRNERIK